mgnify:CR=1 FL=1|jgi:N6-adenosine-specific RNA methylase IME4
MSDRLTFHEYADIFPMLSLEELDTLAADIAANGLLEPITLYEGKVLDGRNRYVACLNVAVDPRFTQYTGDDPLGFVVSKNLHRRQLTSSQRAVVALEVERHIGANLEAVRREKISQYRQTGETTQIVESSQPAAEQAARMVGTNRQYVSDAKKIAAQAPELIPQIASGAMTIPEAKREIRRAEALDRLESIEAQEAKAIQGVYDVIVVDPPWPMEKIERDVRPNQSEFDYPTMSEAELEALDIPYADDCHVWLWTTHKFLPMAMRLLDAWGLKYVCTFVWHKPGGFQPYGLPQYNCEMALYARRGSPSFLDTKAFPVCFEAPRGAHSEKPGAFYDTIRRVTGGRRLDMFSRRLIDGFDAWGNEASDGI